MKTIMVVDDNEDIIKIIKRILEKQGYETISATDVDDCLEKLKNLARKPDLILLDIMMPGPPVSEIVRNIKDVKIAYLSAVTISDEDREKMLLQNNVVDFIPKPFERDELIKIVKKMVGD